MSIRALRAAFTSLKQLPAEHQELACQFIEMLQEQSGLTTGPSVRERERGRAQPRHSKTSNGGLTVQDGLWVYRGKVAGHFADWSGRALQFGRLTRPAPKGLRPSKTRHT